MNDPVRIFHGGFHFFIAVGVYFFWQAIPPPMAAVTSSTTRKPRRETNVQSSYVVIEG